MAISEEQKAQVIELLRQGVLRNEQIAEQVGLSAGTVSAMRSHLTMGTYGRSTDDELNHVIEGKELTFGLERDLQAALRSDIEQLEAGLEVVDGGQERTTEAGRIDITARDRNGTTVVIELKAGAAAPDALTQLLAYMGAVQEESGSDVRGVLVAGDFHQRIRFAARALPNVVLRRYRFSFTFEDV